MTETVRRRALEKLFASACLAAVVLPLLALAWLLLDVAVDGASRLGWDFLTGYPSGRAETAGILPALVGSAYLIGLTAVTAVPIGVGAAVYLEEYGGRRRLSVLIELNLTNLAGVPSVIYGLLGLALFVRTLGMGRSLLAGALTMALLILPIVIVAAREALRAVPQSVREGAYALGATRWQTVRGAVMPMALPGILTGCMLAVSRAMGETAPLIVLGALTFVTFLPDSPGSPLTALPIQIFDWMSRPQHGFAVNAAAGIVVLLCAMLLLNTVAIVVRNRYRKRAYR